MSKIKAIVVDDEQAARNVLTALLQRDCPQIEVFKTCNDVPAAVEAIKEFQPDVVFLDVQMPKYAGYEIVDFINEINFEIVFVTAYDQYAIKAFELNAADYLVKPINRQRLIQAVEKIEQKVNERKTIAEYQLLKNAMQKRSFDHIVIAELGNRRIIKTDEIIAIEASGAYSLFHLTGGKLFTVSKNLKQLETVLPEDGSFFRSHKSWIINTSCIQNYGKLSLEIGLSEGVSAKLSKYKKSDFEELLSS